MTSPESYFRETERSLLIRNEELRAELTRLREENESLAATQADALRELARLREDISRMVPEEDLSACENSRDTLLAALRADCEMPRSRATCFWVSSRSSRSRRRKAPSDPTGECMALMASASSVIGVLPVYGITRRSLQR